ncbi:hypothetical protein SPONN_1484 [uncultured Candidatus Thioglobus sp.]|nr:hypothetical protein SPONN_1484 [uncultured Candidatus Thioglobus sp.]
MNQTISGYHQDEFNDWVAELACGHYQHIRHNPPWTNREWTTTVESRNARLGEHLFCKKCESGAPKDALN